MKLLLSLGILFVLIVALIACYLGWLWVIFGLVMLIIVVLIVGAALAAGADDEDDYNY